MRWERRPYSDGEGGEFLAAENQLGDWSVEEVGGRFVLYWCPPFQPAEAEIGRYRSEKIAKAAAKRYAKKLAAACKAFARMGWT